MTVSRLIAAALLLTAGFGTAPATAQVACPCFNAGTIRALCAQVPAAERKIDRATGEYNYRGADIVCGGRRFRAIYTEQYVWQKLGNIPHRICGTLKPGAEKFANSYISEAQLDACFALIGREAARLGLE